MAKPKKGQLPYFAGEKGVNRVRLYAHPKTGILWVDCRVPMRLRQSLGHRDIERGKQEAEMLAAKLRTEDVPRPADLTLQALFDMYEREVTPTKSAGVQKHDRRTRRLFERCWGPTTKVKTLDRRDWDRFIQQRRSGQLRPDKGYHKGTVRDRQIEYDLRFLLAVCNWATTVRVKGTVLLERNPFRGFPVPVEQNLNQPIVTDEEIGKMRAVAAQVDQLCPLYLELVYHTGHRSRAVGLLRWRDVDLAAGTICFRAEYDKMGLEHTVPLDESVVKLLREQQRAAAAIGDSWIFPSPTDPAHPISRHLLRDWWKRLERAAKLKHVKGRGWHSMRRRFASDLDHLPAKQLMALGGWKTMVSVVRYQKHSTEELREGLKSRRRRASGE